LDADAVETLLDGRVRLVDRDDALARGDHGLGGFGKLFDAHGFLRVAWGSPQVYPAPAGKTISKQWLRARRAPRPCRPRRPAAGAGCWSRRGAPCGRRW